MQAIDPIYEAGCAAGRAGMGPENNPYVPGQPVEEVGLYMLSPWHRWEHGRKRGLRWCPHCNGTGQLPEGV